MSHTQTHDTRFTSHVQIESHGIAFAQSTRSTHSHTHRITSLFFEIYFPSNQHSAFIISVFFLFRNTPVAILGPCPRSMFIIIMCFIIWRHLLLLRGHNGLRAEAKNKFLFLDESAHSEQCSRDRRFLLFTFDLVVLARLCSSTQSVLVAE